MKQNKTLSALVTQCPFPEVFEDTELHEGSSIPVPRRKVGHLRADYDGYRWWNTAWPCHNDLLTDEISEEIDATYAMLIAKDGLKDLDTLRQYCRQHMEACVSQEYEDEFNFYLTGKHCDFWIRLITRTRDYNMYLYAFAKKKEDNPLQPYFDYLEQLRKSGETNMFGAVPYLLENFPELNGDRKRAGEILDAWMHSFETEGSE